MADWTDLQTELDAWQSAGRTATLWWRDDDAVQPSPPLDRLLALAAAQRVPVALAVIPADTGAPLRDHLAADAADAWVLQHGWAHADHSANGERQNEYGPERPIAVRVDELAAGWRKLADFPRAWPALVAPWNRIDPALLPALPQAGLTGVSTLGPRPATDAAPGVRQVNVHVDIMNWQTRRFAGDDAALGQVLAHLRARRDGTADAGEPTGVMTHHSFHDEEAWTFIGALLAATRPHPAARWLTADAVFRA
jgi:hypothetical protein